MIQTSHSVIIKEACFIFATAVAACKTVYTYHEVRLMSSDTKRLQKEKQQQQLDVVCSRPTLLGEFGGDRKDTTTAAPEQVTDSHIQQEPEA